MGALAGAALGAVAGPAGAAVGAVLGGAVGVAAGVALEQEEERQAVHERELDEAIGVVGGELGAPNLRHPPARLGAYSAASSGVGGLGGGDDAPDEGPMPHNG